MVGLFANSGEPDQMRCSAASDLGQHCLPVTCLGVSSPQWVNNRATIKGITKTYLYNFDPLKPHFYIVKLGFTGVYIIFLISARKHGLWVLVRTASARQF